MLPLVLSVALGVGARILMTIPADMPARWIFQTTRARAASHGRGGAQSDAPARRVPDGRGCRVLTPAWLWGPRSCGCSTPPIAAPLALLLCEAAAHAIAACR